MLVTRRAEANRDRRANCAWRFSGNLLCTNDLVVMTFTTYYLVLHLHRLTVISLVYMTCTDFLSRSEA